jgi:hypothetical protein
MLRYALSIAVGCFVGACGAPGSGVDSGPVGGGNDTGGPSPDGGTPGADAGPFVSPWTGAQIAATSCELQDVRAAVARATDGDTVNVPAGTCTWNGELALAHGVRVLGAGVDATRLAGGRFTATTDRTFRVSGMTLSGTAGFNVTGHAHGWRIDHVRFERVTGFAANRIVWVEPVAGGYTSGLVDHCDFNDPQSIQVHVREFGGNGSYLRPLDLGGPDAIYVEDCNFNHTMLNVSDPVTDCEGGGRIVVRHSYIANSYTEMHDAIIGGLRSCRRWETYENRFTTTYASGQCGYVGIRGGTGVVFNNTFLTANDCEPIQVALYRTHQDDGDPWDVLCSHTSGRACLGAASVMPAGCASDADCGGAAGSCVPLDGPSDAPSGYPCRDQIGTDGNSPQTSRPALFWNNRFASGSASTDPVLNMVGEYVRAGRDYCVGATMPATCNNVPTTYQPYAYPHPLTGL